MANLSVGINKTFLAAQRLHVEAVGRRGEDEEGHNRLVWGRVAPSLIFNIVNLTKAAGADPEIGRT